MSQCQNCGNCVYWERNWINTFEGYCAARVEVTDLLFKCEEHRDLDDKKSAETSEASVGGVV